MAGTLGKLLLWLGLGNAISIVGFRALAESVEVMASLHFRKLRLNRTGSV